MLARSLFLAAFLLLAGGALYGQSAAPREAATAQPAVKFDPARDAAADIQAALVRAKQTNRRVLLDVGGEWCIWCRRLDSLFVTKRDLNQYLQEHYVVVKVNYSKENKNEAVLSKYPKIPGYPHFFVLAADGNLVKSQGTGELESGKGHDPAKVLAFLKKYALPGT